MIKISKLNLLLFIFMLCAVVFVYYPGLSDGFYFDDFHNIVDNQQLHVENPTVENFWQAAWSGNSSSLGRPLAYFSFSLNFYFSGLDAKIMKITNLGIHMLIGILLFLLTYKLLNYYSKSRKIELNTRIIGMLTCSIWLLHPINLTSVLYVVQRMTSLAALFSVCALICYTFFRIRQNETSGLWIRFISSILIFSFLSLIAKENAVLLLFYFTCIEIFVFKFSCYNVNDIKILKSCYIIVYTLTFCLLIYLIFINNEWIEQGYSNRSFSLIERINTEFRILVWYLKMIIMPNITEMGLYLDDFTISTSLVNPISTILSLAILLLMLVFGVIARNKFTLVSLGIFWYFSGHLLESTIIPLELIFEHRNYLPSFGIILVLSFIFERLLSKSKYQNIFIIACLSFVSILGYTTFNRAQHWKDPLSHSLSQVEYHPKSIRAHSDLAGQLSGIAKTKEGGTNEEVFAKADYHFSKAAELDPYRSSNLLARLMLYTLHNKTFPKGDFTHLTQSLKVNKLDAGTLKAMRELTYCHIDKICNLTTEDYMAIMYAPLESTKEENNYLPYLLIYLSEYYLYILNDPDTAVNLIKQIVDKRPDELNYRFSLVKAYIASGQFGNARNQLDMIDKLDKYGFYSVNLNEWKDLIEEATTN